VKGTRLVSWTPCHSARRGRAIEELRLALSELGAACHLVLSAAAKPGRASRHRSGVGAGTERVIFTQLDLTPNGGLLAAGARWGIPISYVSSGPECDGPRPGLADALVAELLAKAVVAQTPYPLMVGVTRPIRIACG